jgi:hypothetical protein
MKNNRIIVGLVAVVSILTLVSIVKPPDGELFKTKDVSIATKSDGEERENSKEELVYEIAPTDYLDVSEFVQKATSSATVLSDAEKNGLLLMREEEKLARDVYNVLANKWQLNVFSNIAKSEQTHMNVVGGLLQVYSIADPISNDVVGKFTNPDLQTLYTNLTEEGLVSRNNALKVGAQIEDLDIYDLERLLRETNRIDIINVYQNLQKGSRNHLRAFVRQVEKNGASYTPAYISATDYQNIINSQQENGRI